MKNKRILITGGSGFIGCNAADRMINNNDSVTVLDNLSRPGSEQNLQWLRDKFGPERFEFLQVDIRDKDKVMRAVRSKDVILHLAGQVTVTTSVTNPRDDFENNALGTFNVLEAARLSDNNPIVLFSSTNKVYGDMLNTPVSVVNKKYSYSNQPFGIPESYPLDFHSPYGCSKGTADQYTRDYARIYGLRTVVFRQSCIYGPRQMGMEDQGWIAWFMIAVLTGQPITIYGDGNQVRDILHVNDLIDAYQAAIDQIDIASGQIYNIGGGPNNIMSVWSDLGPCLEKLYGEPIPVIRADWRPGDQRIYVSDIRKSESELCWSPKISVDKGIDSLWRWIYSNRSIFEKVSIN
jgi:CDP-paratose 2-epimerase